MATKTDNASRITSIEELQSKGITYPEVNDKGRPLKTSHNLEHLLKEKAMGIRYNVITKEVEAPRFRSASMDDLGIEIYDLAQNNDLNISLEYTKSFAKKIAKQNPYNPVVEYLMKRREKWDGRSRVDELCATIESGMDAEFKRRLLVKWLVNTVRIAFNEGQYNCEGVLVIQGDQRINKTRWIRSIVPNPEWVKTGLSLNPDDRDSVIRATTHWIVELGEMDSTMKSEQAALKQFFTEPMDMYRVPWGSVQEKNPRRTAFYATVNKTEFLKDDTGNRRYWTIPATKLNVDHEIDLDQLWGEIAMIAIDPDFEYWITDSDYKKLNMSNQVFEEKSSAEIKILEMYNWDTAQKDRLGRTNTQIGNYIDESNTRTVYNALQKLVRAGLIEYKAKGRIYMMPPTNLDIYQRNNPTK